MSRAAKIKEIQDLMKPAGHYLYAHIIPDGMGGIHWQVVKPINNPQVHDDLIVKSCHTKEDVQFFDNNQALVKQQIEQKRKEIYSI